MTGTIHPGRLLETLKVLLSPSGGIKSEEEVVRIAKLMSKFSRKLVSKVIYTKILRASSTELLDKFLEANGWNLLTSWLTVAVKSLNSPLIRELLLVLLVCPPPPTNRQQRDNKVLSLVWEVQLQNNCAHRSIASEVLSNWTKTVNSTNSIPLFSEQEFLPQDSKSSSMSPTRRSCRSVIDSNRLATIPKKMIPVTFQAVPLQEITDALKLKRKGTSEVLRCPKLEFTKEIYEDMREIKGTKLEDIDGKSLELELSEIDQACKQLTSQERPSSLNLTVEVKDELKSKSENLTSKSQMIVMKDGTNNNKCLVGVEFEGSAKELRLARREKFQREQRQVALEEENERKARWEREQERERKKQRKREKEKEEKRKKEQEQKERRVGEEKEKRKKMEEEFKRKRELEVARKAKERENKKVVSFRKSELRNDLDINKKNKIKQLALQLKLSTTDPKFSIGDTKEEKGLKNPDAAKHTEGFKVKPIFSTAKNKNKDLLETLTTDNMQKNFVIKSKQGLSDGATSYKKRKKVSSDLEIVDSDPLFKIPRKSDEVKRGDFTEHEVNNEHLSKISSQYDVFKETNETSELKRSKNYKNVKLVVEKTKPLVTLKPVSQLKESSLFGSSLDVVGSNSKKRKSSFKDYKDRKLKTKGDVASNLVELGLTSTSAGCSETATTVFRPREVSGILIIQHGSLPKKKVSWTDEKDLVNIEYFEVDDSERVNVHKLKFEEIRLKERKHEKASFITLQRPDNFDANDLNMKTWPTLVLLDSARNNFIAGGKSHEREIQKLREQRVLPFLSLGNIVLDPSEPDLPSDRGSSMISKIIHVLAEDVSGEGTYIDYTDVVWPGQLGSEVRIGTEQFYQAAKLSDGQFRLSAGSSTSGTFPPGHGVVEQINNTNNGLCPAAFGRGSLHSRGVARGSRGRFGIRGGFLNQKKIPCKYWIKGTCVVGDKCQFQHDT